MKGVTLKEHFEALLAEKDKRDQQRFEAQTLGITAAMTAAEKAINKADTATEKRFDGVNEFRQTLQDQNTTFMLRTESEAQNSNSNEKIASVISRLDRIDGRKEGMSTAQGTSIIVLTIIISFCGLLVAFWPHLK